MSHFNLNEVCFGFESQILKKPYKSITLNATWISVVLKAPGLRVVRLMSSNLGINPFTVCVALNGAHAGTLKLDVNIWDSQRG